MKKYLVIGNPIEHSLSPLIHNYWMKKYRLVDSLYDIMIREKLDFITNMAPPSWPHGLDVSIFNMHSLQMAYKNAESNSDREHVVPWMWRNCNINNNG